MKIVNEVTLYITNLLSAKKKKKLLIYYRVDQEPFNNTGSGVINNNGWKFGLKSNYKQELCLISLTM